MLSGALTTSSKSLFSSRLCYGVAFGLIAKQATYFAPNVRRFWRKRPTMPFDQEFDAPEFATRRFEPTDAPPEADVVEAASATCGCPICSGAVINSADVEPDQPVSFLNADERGELGPNGKPSLTVAEAAYKLNRTYASWNDFWTQPGVSDVNNKWDDPYWGGAPSYVTFAFRSSISPASMPDDTAGFYRFTEQQINATLLALQSWSDAANVVFNRVGTSTTGEAAYSNSATMLFGNYTTGAAGAAAFAYYPSQSATGGDVWINTDYDDPAAGNYAMLALIHEIGHAIGFSHPGDYNAGEGVSITYAADAEYYEDSRQYTVMSYFSATNTGANHQGAYAATILLDDIAAAQRTYGVNTTTRTGDTVYGFNSTADRPWFLASSSATKLIFAIWDAGGVDTLDFSGYSQAQTITLISGHFSSVGGLTGNVAIAIGATIENAIGGSGADTMIGNSVGNRLTGNAGADTLTGNGGADIFVATVGGGADTITDFSAASDKMDVSAFGGYLGYAQSGADTIVTVAAGITFTLLNFTASALTAANFITGAPPVDPPPAGYNMINGDGTPQTLNGTAASDQIYGLGGDDMLNGLASADWLEGGEGSDVLNGGSGADRMIGGAGDDIYVIDDAGDQAVEASGEGTDRVETTLASFTLGANIENLTGTSASAQTLTGNGLNNTLQGGAAGDTLNGGDGNDTLLGGGGSDAMTGGLGNDTYRVEQAGDTVTEAASGGTDTVETTLASYTLGAEVENLTGISGAGQSLTGNSLANSITGGAGIDTLSGGGGGDTLRGNGGADTFVATAGGGADTIADFVVGTDKIDVSAFGSYQSVVQDGADTLVTVASGVTFRLTGVTASTVTSASFTGIAGPTLINGTAKSETINGTAGADQIFGLGGNDTINAGGGDDEVDGGEGVDKLYGEDGADDLIGGASNDLLDGGVGADQMTGGLGADTYYVDNAGDLVVEDVSDPAKDFVFTTLASYTLGANLENLTGTLAGGQTLTGNNVENIIQGAGGNDVIDGLAGQDTLRGGAGGDVINGGSEADKIYGDDGADQLFGGAHGDSLWGGAANDVIDGGLDGDKIYGEAGDDRIIGGEGTDTLTGGDGADVFVVSVGGGGDLITDFVIGTDKIDLTAYGAYQSIVQQSADTLITFAKGVTMKLQGVTAANLTDASFIGLPAPGGFNNINGTDAADVVYGTALADYIKGLGGADTIRAGSNNDKVEGGDANDKIFGEAGNDELYGEAGDDVMQGGDGNDLMSGGLGADSLTGGTGADIFVVSLNGGADTVLDFEMGVDKIDLGAYGDYLSATAKSTDTILTFATGVTLRLKNITPAQINDAMFIGLSSPSPVAAAKPEIDLGASSLVGAAGEDAPVSSDVVGQYMGRGLSHAWDRVEPSRDAFHEPWLL